ncbi:hypothetical protein ACOME3_009477 [Neoechinorhynchus agilis]
MFARKRAMIFAAHSLNTNCNVGSRNLDPLSFKRNPTDVTDQKSGLRLISYDFDYPFSFLHVSVKAGSKYETVQNAGASQMIKSFAGGTTKSATSVEVVRRLDHFGVRFWADHSRDFITYKLCSSHNNLHQVLPILLSVVTEPEFKGWEVQDVKNRLIMESNIYEKCAEQKLSDMLCADSLDVSNLTKGKLHDYHRQHFKSNRFTVVSAGIPADSLTKVCSILSEIGSADIEANSIKTRTKNIFYPRELRSKFIASDPTCRVVLSYNASSLDPRSDLVTEILQRLIGSNHRYFLNGSRFSVASRMSRRDQVLIDCERITYNCGAGLLSIKVESPDDMSEVLKELMGLLTCEPKFTTQQVSLAKMQLSTDLKCELDECLSSLMNAASAVNDSLAHRYAIDPYKCLEELDKVSTDEVNSLAKSIFDSTPSMATLGNIDHSIYKDDI